MILPRPQYMINPGEFRDADEETREWYNNLSSYDNICAFGTVIYIDPDGNFGYHVVISILRKEGIISNELYITTFRKVIRDFIYSN